MHLVASMKTRSGGAVPELSSTNSGFELHIDFVKFFSLFFFF